MEKSEDQVGLLEDDGAHASPMHRVSRNCTRIKWQVAYIAFLHLVVLLLCFTSVYLGYQVHASQRSHPMLYCKYLRPLCPPRPPQRLLTQQ